MRVRGAAGKDTRDHAFSQRAATLVLLVIGPGSPAVLAAGTLQTLIDNTPAGGTASVPAGTYTEYVTINKNLTLQAASGAVVILQPPSGHTAISLVSGASTVTLRNLTIQNASNDLNAGGGVLVTNGTLTIDHVILEIYCNVFKNENEEVLRDAYLISHFQTGLKNVLDRAVMQHKELHRELSIEQYVKVDELPFDFSRRVMSVVIKTPEGAHRLICKGAPEAVAELSDGELRACGFSAAKARSLRAAASAILSGALSEESAA